MAKYKGGSSGGDLGDFDIESLLTKEDVKPVGGIIGQAFYKLITRNMKTKEEAINLEIQRIKKEGTEQEKQSAHNVLVRHAKEKILKSMSEKDKKELEILNQQIRYAEKKLADFELNQKRASDIYKQQESKLRIEIANAKKAGQNTDALEQELKDRQAQFQKESKSRNRAIQSAKKSLSQRKDKTGQIYAPIEKALEYEYRASGLDMTRVSDKDYVLNEHGSSADLAHANTLASMEYDNAKLQSFVTKTSGGRGSLDMDSGDDEPIIRTKPQQKQAQQEKRPNPQEVANILSTDLGDLSAGIVSAVPDKMQQNLNQNMRDEELKHRTERESLTDQYREQVLDNLNQQTYQLTTIQENLHAIYDNMGQGGSGGGLLGGLGDMLSSLVGGALASKGMGLVKGGLGLAKGALTKIPLIGGIAGAGFGAFDGALDTEAIMRLKGYTDPSQISWLDRIQSAGAGGLAGAGNGVLGFLPNLLGLEFKGGDVLEGFDRWGNILSGNGNRTDAEVRAMQDSQTSIDADEAEMNALLASRGIIQTADGSYQIKDNSIHGQILEKMGIETAKVQQEQELAELNEGMGGVMNSSVSNVTNNSTTNIIPESPRFRVNDTATMALSAQGL